MRKLLEFYMASYSHENTHFRRTPSHYIDPFQNNRKSNLSNWQHGWPYPQNVLNDNGLIFESRWPSPLTCTIPTENHFYIFHRKHYRKQSVTLKGKDKALSLLLAFSHQNDQVLGMFIFTQPEQLNLTVKMSSKEKGLIISLWISQKSRNNHFIAWLLFFFQPITSTWPSPDKDLQKLVIGSSYCRSSSQTVIISCHHHPHPVSSSITGCHHQVSSSVIILIVTYYIQTNNAFYHGTCA